MNSLASRFICPEGGIARLYPEWIDALTPVEGVNPERRLIETPDIEIERPLIIDPRLREHIEGKLHPLFPVEKSTATSLYFDNSGLDMLIKSLLTLRDRPGGIASDGTVYHDLFGLKFRHKELQKLTDDIAVRYSSGVEDVWKFIPDVRGEIEREQTHPIQASELRYGDLPPDIQDILKMALGKIEAENFVSKPFVNTVVGRNKYSLYLNAEEFCGDERNPFGHLSFDELDIRPKYTHEMKQAGHWICIDPSFDNIDNRRPKLGAVIAEILGDRRNTGNLMVKCLPSDCMEYELKPEESGRKLIDTDIVRSLVGFGLALQRTDRKVRKQALSEQRRQKIKDDYIIMRPVLSKAVRATQALYPCYKKGQGPRGAAFKERRHGMP